MEEIIIEHNEKYHFQKVYCTEGHYLTTFKDGDDILSFYAATVIFAPEDIDVKALYHCITEEEYEAYMAQKEEAEIESISGDTIEVDEYEAISGDTFNEEAIEEDTIIEETTEEE